MLQVLINLLSLNALNTTPEVYVALAVAWLLLLSAGLVSIFGSKTHVLLKIFWTLVVVAAPVAGLFLYSFWCFVSADWGFLKMFGLHRQASSLLSHPPKQRAK